MARKAKQLVGILSTPNPKPPKLVDLINESDDMSGKKDFVSIRQGEKRVQVQKRLVCLTFKVQFPK